jgi:hypothetical protein
MINHPPAVIPSGAAAPKSTRPEATHPLQQSQPVPPVPAHQERRGSERDGMGLRRHPDVDTDVAAAFPRCGGGSAGAALPRLAVVCMAGHAFGLSRPDLPHERPAVVAVLDSV